MSARIGIRCTPASRRESIAALPEGGFSAHVSAVPEGGKANAALCKLVAKAAGVPKSSVRVVAGGTSREKVLEIQGMSKADVEAALLRATTPRGDS
jgi:uncharacterized protein